MYSTRKALVLGGTGDIGSAIADALRLDHNDHVIAVGRRDIDLSSKDSVEHFLSKHGNDFDVLVHSAGMNKPGLFESLPLENIEEAFQANLMGFLRLTQAFLPHWKSKRQGHVIIISSLYGFLSRKGRMPYAISKHALVGAMKTLAIELPEHGVLVNSVSPGYINTKMTAQNNSPETIRKFEASIPVGSLGTPSDVAQAVSFLASPKNKYINGHDLVVDGGYSIGGFQN